MRRLAAVGSTLLLATVIPALASGSGTSSSGSAPITVKPARGSSKSKFVVSFRAPDRTGRVGSMYRYYVVSATGPSRAQRRACLDGKADAAPPTRAHARVRVTLSPGQGGHWCLGRFRGTVAEQERPVCPPRELCPLFVA